MSISLSVFDMSMLSTCFCDVSKKAQNFDTFLMLYGFLATNCDIFLRTVDAYTVIYWESKILTDFVRLPEAVPLRY